MYQTGTELKDSKIKEEIFTLKYKDEVIGTLVVDIDISSLQKKYLKKTALIFFAQALKAFAVSIIILFLFNTILTKYLVSISAQLKSRKGGKFKVIELERSNSNDELTQVVSSFNDISLELEGTNQELLTFNDRLESAVQERTDSLGQALKELLKTQEKVIAQEKLISMGQVTAGIAHEIKNPIHIVNNTIKVVTALLEKLSDKKLSQEAYSELGIEVQALFRTIDRNCERMNSMVSNMLLLTRGDSKDKELLNLKELFEATIDDCYKRFRAKNDFECKLVKLIEKVGNSLVYKDDFSRVLINIIDNAFYALSLKKENGSFGLESPKVELSLFLKDSDIYFVIKDNGSGIAAKDKDKIFDPFFSSKPAGAGSGLGLAIANEIVKRHDGTIELDTVEGYYSQFTIILPLNT